MTFDDLLVRSDVEFLQKWKAVSEMTPCPVLALDESKFAIYSPLQLQARSRSQQLGGILSSGKEKPGRGCFI